VLLENGNVKILEESSKVGKKEKKLRFMQTRFLPAWIIKKEEELSCEKQQSRSFSYYASLYLNECQHLKDLQNIHYRLNRVLRDFADLDIKSISKTKIKQWIINLKDPKSKKPLSHNSQKKYLGIFRAVFKQATDDDMIERNIVNDIELTNRQERDLNEVRPFDTQEVNTLLEASKNSIYGSYMHAYLNIAFKQGMSPSEILGLHVDDIDFVNKTISINRDVTRGKINSTKNMYRQREIPLFESVYKVLKELVDNALKLGTPWLFSDKNRDNLYDIETIRGSREIIKNGKLIKNDTR
jgi:integrase